MIKYEHDRKPDIFARKAFHIFVIIMAILFSASPEFIDRCTTIYASEVQGNKAGLQGAKTGTKGPELVLQDGHIFVVSSVSFSPDGRYLISGGQDTTIKLWETETGRCLRSWKGHAGKVTSVVYSPKGGIAASCGEDKAVYLWNVTTGALLKSPGEQSGIIRSIAFSPDGKYLIAGCGSGTLKIWELSTGSFIRIIESDAFSFNSVAFSPDGTSVVAGSADEKILLWNFSTGKLVTAVNPRKGSISTVTFSPEGHSLAVNYSDGVILLLDAGNGSVQKEIKELKHSGGLAFTSDGKYLAAGEYEGVRLIDRNTGALGKKFTTKDNGYTYSLSCSRDGKFIAAGGQEGLALWDTGSGTLIRHLSHNTISSEHVAISHDNNYIATTANRNITISRTDSAPVISAVETNESAWIRYLSFLPDKDTFFSLDENGNVSLWDAVVGKALKSLTDKNSVKYRCYSMSKDGKYCLSGSEDGKVRIWTTDTWKCKATLGAFTDYIISLAFSPDGKLFAVSGCNKNWDYVLLKLFESESGKYLGTLKESSVVYSTAFSPDGRYLAAGNLSAVITIFDVKNLSQVRMIGGHKGYISTLAYSPDGKYLASGSEDTSIKIWDQSGACVQTLEGHSGKINELAYSADGKYIVSVGDDQKTFVWDSASGKELFFITVFRGGDWVICTPEGYFDCSPGGKQYIGWTLGMKNYPFDQFYDEFYTPGLMLMTMKGEKTAKKHNLQRGFAQPPEIAIISPRAGSQISTDTVEVVVNATEVSDGGISDIRLYHQGKQVEGGKNLKIEAGNGKSQTARFAVQLLSGKNTLKATAYNRDHTVESAPAELTIGSGVAQKTAKAYVLCVGINEYMDPKLNLHSARKDAEALAEYLRKKGRSLFNEQQITILCDNNATNAAIVKAMNDISVKANPEDVVILFLSGHGEIDPSDSQYYFIPHDFSTKEDITTMFKKSGLAASTIGDMIKAIKARKVLVIFDTCHSGKATVAFRGMAEMKAMKMLAKSYGLHILAASADEQLAGESSDLGHGIFTYAILEGLEGKADSEKDGIVTVRELLPFVEFEVEALSVKHLGRKQYPVIDSRGMDFPLVVK
ncbi:MAG: caspase family protein [Vulcanimicrobiota bacterium]